MTALVNKMTSIGKEVEKKQPLYTVGENVTITENSMKFPQKQK
jgi:hypothetical protein